MSKNKNKVSRGRGWKFGAIATAGTLTVVTATLAGVGAIALNVLPTKPQDLSKVDKINYVALGDGLTSGANMLVGEDYVSFADFFASDLKNANRLGTYENFADSSNKIFDVLNGALMNGAQREAIKNADLITITAGTNDLLALMELFGVPLADLSTNEERDRGGLNDVKTLDEQYAERQSKVVDVLESLGNAIANKDFTGAISIDENVYNDLFLAVNLNLTLLTTEIAKIAPGAKIVLLSPFNPVEGLPTSLTDAPLGNGGRSFNQLFTKLIDTYDTVAMLNPACEHINMGEIQEFSSNTETTDVYSLSGDGVSYTLTKPKKRFNSIDMNPSTYGHQLIGNGLFKELSGEMGIVSNDSLLSKTRIADNDTEAEITDGTVFSPELYDESNNGDLVHAKAAFAVAEQVLEALDTMKYGSNLNEKYVIKNSNGIAKLTSKDNEFEWLEGGLPKSLLQGEITTDTTLAELMAWLQVLMASNSVDENSRLNISLKGNLNLSAEEMKKSELLFNSILTSNAELILNGSDTSIISPSLILNSDGSTLFSNGQIIDIYDEFGVQNVAQLYGMTNLTPIMNEISTSWNDFFVSMFDWYKIGKTSYITTPPRFNGGVKAVYSLFGYTSPFYQIVKDNGDITNFMKRLRESSGAELVDIDLFEKQLQNLVSNPTNSAFVTNPSYQKKLIEDVLGISSKSELTSNLPADLKEKNDAVDMGQNYHSGLPDEIIYDRTVQGKANIARLELDIAEYWASVANTYANDPINQTNDHYSEIAKLVNALHESSINIKENLFD